jgi:GTP-binding protein
MFADTAKIEVRAGKGGDGRLSFRHEKYRAMGGPDGGDGGHGGNVVFQVDHNLNTLTAYRTKRRVEAEAGEPGGGNRMHGKNGQDIIIKVPQGTQISEDGQLLVDLAGPNQSHILAKGGRGGFGNAHFKSSTRQAPRTAELGEPGESHHLDLELKLVADVGLIGLPNAGKSTFLSVISNAKPEIADYPFTTLVPNLGVVDVDDFGFLAADIPGLIEGASGGKGLGDEFLRHITRTAVLLHLIDAASPDPKKDYATIQSELGIYGHDLLSKPQIVVLTKQETVTPEDLKKTQASLKKLVAPSPLFTISSQAHTGLLEVLRAAVVLVKAARAERLEAEASAELPVIDQVKTPDRWRVEREPGGFRITGERIESFARRTNFDSPDSVARLQDIFRKVGLARELARLDAKPGDEIRLGSHQLPYKP